MQKGHVTQSSVLQYRVAKSEMLGSNFLEEKTQEMPSQAIRKKEKKDKEKGKLGILLQLLLHL
uniref:Uncharacterized protein n=1 Tax=Romanomermis culicivorax TaxID=13658 RepID=A0A915KMG8_ROMCU